MFRKIRSRAPNFPDLSKPVPTNVRRFDDGCEHLDLRAFGDSIYRSGAVIDRKVWGRKRKMCRLVIVESGLRLRRTRNGCVKKNH